jgi:hypothetical protein
MRRYLCLSCLLATVALAATDYEKSIADWRANRAARLTAPDSWLALIGRHPLDRGTHTVGSAKDNAIQLAAGPTRLGTITHADDGRVTIGLAEGVDAKIDGTDARSAELIYKSDKPTYVRFGTANFYVMQRGDQLFLRVRDTESPRRKNFTGIEAFPTDPSWRIEADWVPFEPAKEIPITNMIGQTSPNKVPGKAVFTRDGQTIELWPIQEGDGEELFFIISDGTSGIETYGASRFLYAAPKGDRIVLDFNKAYNPPCAFTPFATCPLPPKQNRMAIRITAGEKTYAGEH